MTPPLPDPATLALFLDFDGTLAPLGDDAAAIVLPEAVAQTLTDLEKRLGLGPVLISGRDLDDLSARIPHGFHRIGNHGLREAKAGAASGPALPSAPSHVRAGAQGAVADHDGAWVETKGSILAVHVRAARGAAGRIERALRALDLAPHGYALETGRDIFELKPRHASKGAALRRVMADRPGLAPVMVGDDTTDESAIIAAQDLGGFGIRVGTADSAARYRLDGPVAVAQWLGELLRERSPS